MSFAAPNALLLALLAAPIILFYILKIRLRRVPISTNIFWKQIFDERPPRSIWQYLRHLLSLLVQLALLGLLVLAAADPLLAWQTRQARRLVAVIDNSASMSAADVEPTRFAAAIESAASLAEGLRFGDEMAVVLAGPTPEVLLGMSDHVPTLKRTLRDIKTSDNPTELDGAIELGKQLVGNHPHGQVIVFSDFCATPPDSTSAPTPTPAEAQSAAPPEVEIEYRSFATPAANVGITQFQVRRSLIDPLGYEILVAVRNASPSAVSCRVELELDGLPVDILPIDLAAEEQWSRSLEKASLTGGRLAARLTQIAPQSETNDVNASSSTKAAVAPTPTLNSLATDDEAWAVLPERRVERVLIVSPGNLFLQKVFEANPLVSVEVVRELPTAWPENAIIVLHNDVPAQLPPGRVLVVDPRSDCDAWRLGAVVENPIVTDLDATSPLMTHVRLDNVLMPKARQLEFHTPPHVLAGAVAGDVIYAELARPQGKCLVLTVNLDEGDLAFRTAFPIMVANALTYFAGVSGELRESLATGQTIEQVLPESVEPQKPIVLKSPSGRRIEIVRRAEALAMPVVADSSQTPADAAPVAAVDSAPPRTTLGPFDEAGVWTLEIDRGEQNAEPIMELAVNLANERESDLRPPPELAQQSAEPLVASWLARPPWFWLVAVASALCVGEWFMYQRRIIT
jgi:hypothetical protein